MLRLAGQGCRQQRSRAGPRESGRFERRARGQRGQPRRGSLGVGAGREPDAGAEGEDGVARAERQSRDPRDRAESAPRGTRRGATRGTARGASTRRAAARGASARAGAGPAESAAGAGALSSARAARRMEDAGRSDPERAVPDQSLGGEGSAAIRLNTRRRASGCTCIPRPAVFRDLIQRATPPSAPRTPGSLRAAPAA